ncbi:MAG: hypothetical protein ACJ74U_05610 [Jatrophihabitantaceae bacterium]
MLLALLSIGRTPDLADLAGVSVALGAATGPEVDAALDQLDGHRLIIDTAELAGLNLVLARLLRAGRLAELETAVLLDRPVRYLTGLGLPADRAGQLALARTGTARLVGVVRDDSGGVCVSTATLTPWTAGDPWWVRAVVDDQRLCDGHVRSLTMRRLGPAELVAEARIGRFRVRRQRGRALQLACDPAQIVADGIGRERPRGRRTFWSEPNLWRLAIPG